MIARPELAALRRQPPPWPPSIPATRNVGATTSVVIAWLPRLDIDEIRACHRDLGGDLDAMVEHLRVSKHALRRRIQELGLA